MPPIIHWSRTIPSAAVVTIALVATQAVAAECGITPADAPQPPLECALDTISICTLNDPSRAERLLLAAIGDGQDPVPLYLLGLHYRDAPPLFRDPTLAQWYLDRAASLGYEPAIAALAPVVTPVAAPDTVAPAPTTRLREPLDVPDPPSTLAGRELSIQEVMEIAYAAGFCTEAQLMAVVAIAIAESSLFTEARNWKPENGLRPATDYIGVQGPPEAWLNGQQMHSDRGLWQISSFAWPDISDIIADEPTATAAAVYEVSNGGIDFSAWDSFVRGTAQLYYDRHYDGYPPLRPVVQAFLGAQI